MEQLKVIRAIEEAVFEVSKWPRDILWTAKKTLWPTLARNYVNQLWEEPEEKRFKNRMSPILFWLLTVVTPFYLLINLKLVQASTHHPSLLTAANMPWPLKMFVSSLLIAAWPMACARIVQKQNTESADSRDRLKQLFTMFCLTLAPATWILLLNALFVVLFQEHAKPIISFLSSLSWIVALVYCFVVFHKESPAGVFKRVDSVMSFSLYSILFSLMTIVTFAVFTVLAEGKPIVPDQATTRPAIAASN